MDGELVYLVFVLLVADWVAAGVQAVFGVSREVFER